MIKQIDRLEGQGIEQIWMGTKEGVKEMKEEIKGQKIRQVNFD